MTAIHFHVTVSAIADLHGHLPQMPSSHLAVVAGDIFPGALDKDTYAQGVWFKNAFLPWVEKQKCNHVVLVAGNHDHWIAANNEQLLKEYAPEVCKKLIYLCDSGFEYKGLKIYGTPWMPTPFVNKAFSFSDDNQLREKYALIPQDVDLLITHTIPYDCNYIGFSDRDMRDLGSTELREAIAARNIRFLVGGHIHEIRERIAHMDFGDHHTEMANVACCDNLKQPVRLPISFVINAGQGQEEKDRPFKIACVGDSITYGFGLDDRLHECYPAQLQKMLGDDYEVKGFGRNGACVLGNGGLPYTSTIEYYRALDWDADAYIICLGTNDLVHRINDEFLKAFKEDYKKLLETFKAKTGHIYLALIPPVPKLFKTWDEEEAIRRINATILEISKEFAVKLIDFNTCFNSRENAVLFSDGIHPNAKGAELLAKSAYIHL